MSLELPPRVSLKNDDRPDAISTNYITATSNTETPKLDEFDLWELANQNNNQIQEGARIKIVQSLTGSAITNHTIVNYIEYTALVDFNYSSIGDLDIATLFSQAPISHTVAYGTEIPIAQMWNPVSI